MQDNKMADQEYQKKLESLQKYIPFLVNMMVELKSKGNREAQLTKIQSLHDMITDTRKKLKIETLTRCEEVLTNIYFKVNPQLRSSKSSSRPTSPHNLPGIESPRSTPQSPSPTRDIVLTKPVTIPTEKVATMVTGFSTRSSPKTNRPRVDVYSNAVINSPVAKAKTPLIHAKVPDMSKPPISLDDLKTLEDDVHKKINDATFVNKTVDELQEVKKQIQLQLRVEEVTAAMGMDEPINTTVRNTLMLSKRPHEGKAKSGEQPKFSKSAGKAKDDDRNSKDSASHKSIKKCFKDFDMFGNLLSSIDDKLIEEKKKSKKGDRRPSLTLCKEDSASTSSLSSEKSDNVKKVKDKATKHKSSSLERDKKTEKKKDDKTQFGTKDNQRSESNCKDSQRTDMKDEDKDKKDDDETVKDLINSPSSSELNLNSSDLLKSESFVKVSDGSKNASASADVVSKPVPTYKRLADKYNPKPKQKITDIDDMPDVDKAVSESIEKLMKTSPVKTFPRPLEQPRFALDDSEGPPVPPNDPNKPVQLPDILQRIFNKPLLGDIIPKRLNASPVVSPSHSMPNRFQNNNFVMGKPGPVEPPKPLVLSPTPQTLQFQPPHFLSPPRPPDVMLSPDLMGRPPLLPTPSSGHGILPTPPIPPNLPTGFLDNGMDRGFNNPRLEFEMPGTPMADFEPPRLEFEPPPFVRNDNINLNPQFIPPVPEHQMRGFDSRNGNFMARGPFPHRPEVNNFNHYDLPQGPGPFYGANQVIHPSPEVPVYMPEPAFFQERFRWVRDRRPGDPRNYREYKEMKERQEREARVVKEKQKEIKDPRLASRDSRLAKEANIESGGKDKSDLIIRDPRLSRGREKSVERDKSRDRQEFLSRERARSRERFGDTTRESRSRESKFDKMYSVTSRARSPSPSRTREEKNEDDEAFMSPLDSLYNVGEKGKTGRGYGVQKFRIPRKSLKDKEKVSSEERQSNNTANKKRIIEISDSEDSDTNDGPIPDNDSDVEVIEDEQEGEVDTKGDNEVKENIDKAASVSEFDRNTSRIKVILNSDGKDQIDLWEPSEIDDFISEYDREFQNLNEDDYAGNLKADSPSETVQRDTIEDRELDVQVEEPSSSQDVLEQLPKTDSRKADDSPNKSAELTEADSSRKSDGIATPLEMTSKSDEPSEQNILAHFFENLLKSRNKKDKKTALFSLIETFSDSFDDKEIQKIRKIINVNEDAVEGSDEEKEEASNSLQSQAPVAQEEQPVVGSTTGEEQVFTEKPEEMEVTENKPLEDAPLIDQTQVNEVTKSTDEPTPQCNEDLKPVSETKDLDVQSTLEPVIVSVGERIKNRRRTPAVSKPKKKFKSELDLLHEDIQDMFIRDGVLTATGKRMCRILKDDPNALASGNQATTPVADQLKKVRKKPGPKRKLKSNNQEIAQNSIKDMRVVINKIPDDVLNVSSGHTRQLRSRNRQSSYAETDDETLESIVDDESVVESFEAGSDKSDLEEDSANESGEDEKNYANTEDMPKPKMKRRKAAKWASGIIPKSKKRKTQQSKSRENSPERTASPVSVSGNDVSSFSESDADRLVEPDKEYYYDYANKQKLNCKLCKYSGHLLTGHYLKEHPHSEVLCSRFSPQIAVEAIKDFTENGKLLESVLVTKMRTKYHYCCRMCGYKSFVSPIFFYEHVTTHTGEYRHQCGICEYFAVTSKTMASHFANVHPDQERKTVKKTYTLAIIFAYMCGECNFVQLKEKSVEDHANIFHLGEKPVIYKINMSTILDPRLFKFDGAKAVEPKPNESSPANQMSDLKTELETTQVEATVKRRKPGPKSKVAVEEKVLNEESEKKDDVKPVWRKRPGPKSKTLPISECDATKPTDVAKSKKPGPKSKTENPKVSIAEETSAGEASESPPDEKETIVPPEEVASPSLLPEDGPVKNTPTRKRRRSVDKLISEDSGDDLDTIITLSSRSSRAAKEKATAKLKTMMEHTEGSPNKRKTDVESSKKINPDDGHHEKPTAKTEQPEQTESNGSATQKETHQVTEMCPPSVEGKPAETNEKDLNVFTCKNDILQEDAKKIEEDRLRKMNELNKSIISRTLKLDFINKLSDKLNEQQSNENLKVRVKQEPADNDVNQDSPQPEETSSEPQLDNQIPEPAAKAPPISKAPVVSKKPVFEEQPTVQQPSINFRQNKPNSLFSNMIEKLQGKVNEAAVQQENITDNAEASKETSPNDSQIPDASEVYITIGDLIRATKIEKEIIYSCHANNCYVATKDKVVFQLHCKFGHKELALQSSLCEKCGVVINVTPDTTLLENLYDHLVFAHSDFIGKSSVLRMRRLSGDKLSVKKEKEVAPPKLHDFEADINRHVLERIPVESAQRGTPAVAMETEPEAREPAAVAGNNEEPPEENPFSFKIANVMSLAESGEDANPPSVASKPLPVPPLKRVPPLTLINAVPKQQTSTQQQLVVKEAKLTTAELSRPKKAPKALQKFIECPGDLYKCPHFYCMFSTNVRTLLTCHLKAHKCDSATMVPCVYCDMKTPWEHVPMHIDIRHASCKFSCSYCLYRAALKEYVFLHQEQSHPDLDYIVIALPSHKAAKKFSIADSKIDYKVLCEPFRCFCKDKEGGEPVLHEYLFETEFVNHLNNAHPSKFASCGYPKCCHEVSTFMMLHHWAVFHGICTYQCSYCKTSSKDISRMYTHFSQIHPNMIPDILVRKNDFLPQDRELRFSDEAFQLLGHIRKVPATLLTSLGNRAHRTIKLIPLNSLNGTSEDPNASSRVETSGIAPGASLVMNSLTAVTQSHPPQLILSNSNLQLIVASTSGSNEKLYLLPTSMVSSQKGHSVTSIAPVNKVTVQTSTSSKSVLNRTEAAPREPVKIGDITIYPSDGSEIVLPTSNTTPELTISAVTSSSSLASHSTVTMLSKSLFNTSVTVSSAQSDKQPLVTPEESDASGKQPKLTAKIKSISKLNAVSSTNNDPAEENASPRMAFQDDITSENDSTAVSEDDILQSAIQSILDQDDDSNNSNTRLGPIVKKKSATDDVSNSNTPVPLLSEIILDPPPLVLISNSSPTSKTTSSATAAIANNQLENEHSSESVTPVEHVEVGSLPESLAERDEEDPLNLGSNEGSNLEVPFIDDSNAVDPLSEDPLTIPSSLNSDLSSGDPLSIDESVAVSDPLEVNVIQPVIQPTKPENAGNSQNPVKISTMQRSVSMASTSDDESDSGNSEKKKRGLIGYQLFRCAVCNLSFSNVKPFKSHIATSALCKKLGLKAFQCVHCERVLKTPQRLAEHIMTHGVQRFSCSLCTEKFTTVGITRLHMKNRHSIHQTNLIPMKADRKNMEMDDFVIKPCQSNSSIVKDKEALSDILKLSAEGFTYTPDQLEGIPIRQIFSTNVKCGLCNYQTKVRVNIIRHLQMHLDEKAVPDTAPVNPVPCLEKNEKMFDKMINLAASSITTSGRMGGGGKDKEKEEEKYPEFIPTHRRFVCCAQGCSYLCPEEANLKHHLVALHSDEFNFTCAHCKIKIEPIDIENVIKHFKLHGLHLYKCQYCRFIHHLKHKVEKHVLDGHLDMAVKVVTIRSMESEPQDFAAQEEAAAPQPTVLSKFKPWSCCMCKAKYHTKGEIQVHIMKKHNIDTQYKCTLCAFKNDQEESCMEHFQEKHPSHAFDIIFVYQKVEEETPKDDSNTPFDTTPLWQRDKPRVRHIRGILFDESSPQPTKSPKKTRTYGSSPKVSVASTSKNSANATTTTSKAVSSTSSHAASKATPNASTSATSKGTPSVSAHMSDTYSKNLFDCIDAVARGVAGALQNKPGSSGLSSTTKAAAPDKEEAGSSSKKDEVSSVKSEFSLDLCIKTDVEDESVNDDVVLLSPQSPKIIVIDSDESDAEIKPKSDENKANDDDTPKTKDKDSKTKPMAKNRCLKRQGTDLLKEAVKLANIEEPDDEDSALATICSKQSLTNLYGQLGMPHNKQWKCPKCKQFKSKRVGDFIFHLYKDFSTFRFRCKMCSDFSITYKYMQDHVRVHPGYNEDIIEPLPPNVKFDTWVHMVLREQSLCILKNVPLFKKQPISGPTDITCYFCSEKFMSVPECCEHMLYHWVMMPYQCQHCPHEFYTVYDLKHHHKIEHPDAKLYVEPKGPTLAKTLQCIENRKKRPLKFSPDTTCKKKARTDDNSSDCEVKKESVTSGVVINTYKAKRLAKSTSNLKFASNDVINIDDDEDDLMIVSKTDDNVPSEDDVFACDLCVYIADTEVLVMKHLHDEHEILTNKYRILSKKKSETDSEDKLACNICDEVLTDLKLRRHFIENHFEGQIYAPYKFKCGLCSSRFLTPSRVKMHFSRVHTGLKLQFQCVIPPSNSRKPKLKQYFCTLCPYTTYAMSTVSIRAHLKGHLKPVLCTYCNLRFRYDSEVLSHTTKQHAGQKPSMVSLEEVMKEFVDTLKIITERAVEFPGESTVSPVVPDKPMKNVAKKSTSTPFTPPVTCPQDVDEYLDLSRIITTFELNNLEYTTTAEEMMKMINMDTYVDVSDCMNDETLSQS